jgi:cyclopropane-fatty-acyl-phospholipid synthase
MATIEFGASQDAIAHHYDVGNDFYGLWLDPTMTYSCALWDDARDLETAQLAKLDYHITEARAKGSERVLDIGCGWGPTLNRLVTTHGVRHAVGLTLSKEQAAHVRARAWPGVDVQIASWAEHVPTAPYDAIVSIGAFEHFARREQSPADKLRGYRTFFRRCHDWLKPGGFMSLQTISYENSRSEDFSEFFAKEIFPESDLPRLSDIAIATETLFEVARLRNDREHYARTASEWRKRLRPCRAQAVANFGEVLVARYEKFLQLLAIGCHTGTMGLLRLTLRRIDRPRDGNVD